MKRKKWFLQLWLMMCLGCMVSCAPTIHWVSMDRLSPAKNTFSERVRRVGVVNNQPNAEQGQRVSGEIILANARQIVDTLAVNLADAAYFDEVVVFDSVLASPGPLSRYDDRQLSPQRVAELTQRMGVDMLVSVELAFYMSESEPYPYSELGSVLTVFKIYLPGRETPVDTITCRQQIAWDAIPADAEFMESIVDVAARLPVPFIVPQWMAVEFPYYSNGTAELRDGHVCIAENDWAGAREQWMSLLGHEERRHRMYGNFNMAVWHEVHDDTIETARNYALKARELALEGLDKDEKGRPVIPSYDYLFINEYLDEMQRRGRNLTRIKQQMLRFLDDFSE